jgi:hypothetical protein
MKIAPGAEVKAHIFTPAVHPTCLPALRLKSIKDIFHVFAIANMISVPAVEAVS